MSSFSFGSELAINKVIATKALSFIFLFHEPSNNILFLLRNNINVNAQLLLFPSAKGRSFIIKYNKCAAFTSIDGYKSIESNV
jgi:hypothetical protein